MLNLSIQLSLVEICLSTGDFWWWWISIYDVSDPDLWHIIFDLGKICLCRWFLELQLCVTIILYHDLSVCLCQLLLITHTINVHQLKLERTKTSFQYSRILVIKVSICILKNNYSWDFLFILTSQLVFETSMVKI